VAAVRVVAPFARCPASWPDGAPSSPTRHMPSEGVHIIQIDSRPIMKPVANSGGMAWDVSAWRNRAGTVMASVTVIECRWRMPGVSVGFIGAFPLKPAGNQAALRKWVAISSSAICTAFRAAPLRRLSDTIHKFRPFATVVSLRTRLTKTASSPAHSAGVT
jgi:hypothetical protein